MKLKTSNDFVAFDVAKSGIFIPNIYRDVCNGDYRIAALLSQIVYWAKPSIAGISKLRVKKDGKYWIAKPRASNRIDENGELVQSWQNELGIPPKALDRCLEYLIEKEVIITDIFKFGKTPMLHIHLQMDILMREMNKIFELYSTRNNAYTIKKTAHKKKIESKIDKDLEYKSSVEEYLSKKSEQFQIEFELFSKSRIEKKKPLTWRAKKGQLNWLIKWKTFHNKTEEQVIERIIENTDKKYLDLVFKSEREEISNFKKLGNKYGSRESRDRY